MRITNAGTSGITILSLAPTGRGFTISDLDLDLPLTLGISSMVNFAPAAAATYTGAVKLSSDTAKSVISALLSGTAADAHSVSLTLDASESPGVTGYNVYRSLRSEGPYAMLTTARVVPGTSYPEDTVEAGTTYYYVVTTVASGIQSVNSNQAEATVPNDTGSTALASSRQRTNPRRPVRRASSATRFNARSQLLDRITAPP